MITVKLWGGLGNQLFQYAFGQYASKILKTKVVFHPQTIYDSEKFTNRNYELGYFQLPITLHNTQTPQNNSSLFYRLKRKAVQQLPILSKKMYIQKNIHSFKEKLFDDFYYEGYWQNLNYINNVEPQLRKEIKPQKIFFEKHQNLLSKIAEQTSASIHIRRDDYINIKANTKIYHVCEMDYYNKAIDVLKKEKNVQQFYIFTQDLKWAKENFTGKEFIFVEGNSPIEDMFLMSKCKHNIIANSTFSWWGAWLNENENKIVIAPKKWYKKEMKEEEMIPKDWRRI